jgi:AcrR family transcriptional regulator
MPTEFLWKPPKVPTRGPKPALDLERITDAAIAVADAENLAAVSMTRVAAELGYTKMSLYRYLPGRTELVALMVERAIGLPPSLDASHWREGLRAWAHRLLDGFLQHPWVLEALTPPRPIGPNEMCWMEAAVSLLMNTSLTANERLDTVAVLAGQVRVIAQQARMTRQPEADLVASITHALS